MNGVSRPIPTRVQLILRALITLAFAMRGESSLPKRFSAVPADKILDNTIQLMYEKYPKLATFLSLSAPFTKLATDLYNKLQQGLQVFALARRLKAYFECSVLIAPSEPMVAMVNSWLAGNNQTTTRSMSLQTGQGYFGPTEAPLEFVPNAESTSFRFNGRTFYVRNETQTVAVRQLCNQTDQSSHGYQNGQSYCNDQDYPRVSLQA